LPALPAAEEAAQDAGGFSATFPVDKHHRAAIPI
jgi:hypothetical protein